MALVSGQLRDITANPMGNQKVVLLLSLNRPGLKATGSFAGEVLPTETVKVVPQSSGDWSVDLALTTNLLDDCWYQLSIQWVGDDGVPGGRMDFPDWKIRVPEGGGKLADLVDRGPGYGGVNNRVVWVSQKAPEHPRRFMLWLQQDPENPDPTNPLNTGNLYEWV